MSEPIEDGKRWDDLPPDSPWWARAIVGNWRNWYKWFTTWIFALLAVTPELDQHAEWFQSVLSPEQFHHLVTALAILGFISRFVNQTKKEQS